MGFVGRVDLGPSVVNIGSSLYFHVPRDVLVVHGPSESPEQFYPVKTQISKESKIENKVSIWVWPHILVIVIEKYCVLRLQPKMKAADEECKNKVVCVLRVLLYLW